jgi:hypothetical protein
MMAEVSPNLVEKFGLSGDKVAYRESEIRRHFPEAWIDGYENLIPAMTNQSRKIAKIASIEGIVTGLIEKHSLLTKASEATKKILGRIDLLKTIRIDVGHGRLGSSRASHSTHQE